MRLIPLAAVAILGLTASAAAQMFGPGMPLPGSAPPQQQQMPPCFQEFTPLRGEAEKRAGAIQAAVKRKANREEVCQLFKRFSEQEAKVVKFVTANQQQCGVPAQAVAQMKGNHERTLKTTSQICAAGPTAGPPRPTGPGLSEALGTARAPLSTDTSAPRSGTMDSLTGNVLAR